MRVSSSSPKHTIFTCFSKLAILAISASLYGFIKTTPSFVVVAAPDSKSCALGNVVEGVFLQIKVFLLLSRRRR